MMEQLVSSFYDACNGRDVAAVVASGTYVDPICGRSLTGEALIAHLRAFFGAFPALHFETKRTIVGVDATVAEWFLTGICDGEIDPELKAHQVAFELSGIDIFDFTRGTGTQIRRLFDRRSLASALGLQTIVEPIMDGTMTFGYSLRDWISKQRPEALGMTWILARDEEEKASIRGLARKIIAHFHEVPGFIGIITGFAGLHGFTFTLWESEDALCRGTHEGAHLQAMQAFRQGLSAGVFTSVWAPSRLNRLWTRCPNGHPNDSARPEGTCEKCGAVLPKREPYI